MSAFNNASKFFHACESLGGWDECKQYVASSAVFRAQCEPLVDITSVEGYVDWMTAFGTTTAAGCSYELHSSSYDDMHRTAVFFATFTACHVGEGGPIPPTHRSTVTDYVYALSMNSDDKITRMCKVWNAPWAMRELGWI
jgi:hypothetical protein